MVVTLILAVLGECLEAGAAGLLSQFRPADPADVETIRENRSMS